jgi:hypothetical protein
MSVKNSKAKPDLEFFLRRIDEIRMTDRERLNARARFERAEAVAEVLATGVRTLARLFAYLTAGSGQPPRRPASSAR